MKYTITIKKGIYMIKLWQVSISKSKVAFTLAEVLITLGIIGVVAALTLPSVIANYNEKATVTKLKKVYSLLDQGFTQMITDEGTVDTWGEDMENKSKRLNELFPKYFQIAKKCDFGESHQDCKEIKYKNRFNSTIVVFSFQRGIYYLKDGTIIYTYMNSNNSTSCFQDKNLSKEMPDLPGYNYGTYGGACGQINVDINGEKGPNIFDKDVFRFVLVTDGIVPAGSIKETIWTDTFNNQCLGKRIYTTGSASCTAWVLFNENMDYLHCDDLSWDGKRSCKEKSSNE